MPWRQQQLGPPPCHSLCCWSLRTLLTMASHRRGTAAHLRLCTGPQRLQGLIQAISLRAESCSQLRSKRATVTVLSQWNGASSITKYSLALIGIFNGSLSREPGKAFLHPCSGPSTLAGDTFIAAACVVIVLGISEGFPTPACQSVTLQQPQSHREINFKKPNITLVATAQAKYKQLKTTLQMY